MSRTALIALAVLGVMVLFGIGLFATGIGFYNTAVKMENGIEAQYNQNRNNYDNYFKKLKETAQVPTMYVEDMKKLWDGVMKGRYGAEGSRAVMQFIQEHNPQLDPGLYRQIQTVIDAGRNAFEADQKSLIAKKQAYANQLSTFPNNIFAVALGLPKIDLSKYDIVTSEETERAFEKKKSDPIDLRPR